MREGYYFENIIKLFIYYCLKAEKIIGHNIYFDTSNIKANILRSIKLMSGETMPKQFNALADKALDKNKRIDTMRNSIQFCAIEFPDRKGYKWPKLTELYKKLFNEDFKAHNAKEDVIATEKCFNKLCELNIIQL